jgi:hypothetical protein
MKRTALILLMVVYLLSIAGIGVNRFYCCGKLASVSFTYGAADNSGKALGEKDNCCKNENQIFKVKDSHMNVAAFEFSSLNPSLLPTITYFAFINPVNERSIYNHYSANSPPIRPDIPFYALNCAYRI